MTVELKNDISIRGTLKSVDQFLNIKLDDIQVLEEIKYPHLVRIDSLDHTLKAKRDSCAMANERRNSRRLRTSSSEAAWFDMYTYLVLR